MACRFHTVPAVNAPQASSVVAPRLVGHADDFELGQPDEIIEKVVPCLLVRARGTAGVSATLGSYGGYAQRFPRTMPPNPTTDAASREKEPVCGIWDAEVRV